MNFSISKEDILNSLRATRELIVPVRDTLPAINPGSVGSIIFDNLNQLFVGFNGSEWVTFQTGSDPDPPVFGTEAVYASAEAIDTDTTGIFQTRLTLNATDLPAGTYRIAYQCELGGAADGQTEVRIDAGAPIASGTSLAANTSTLISGFQQTTLSGNVSITLAYRTAAAPTAVSINDARMELWRIS
jgi:hypothetical protein